MSYPRSRHISRLSAEVGYAVPAMPLAALVILARSQNELAMFPGLDSRTTRLDGDGILKTRIASIAGSGTGSISSAAGYLKQLDGVAPSSGRTLVNRRSPRS